MKRALSVLLALVLSLSLVTPTWAADKTPASGTGNGLTWEKIDNRSTDLRLDKNNAEKVAQDTPEYADTDVVRVSIVLKDASTLANGYSSEDIATNSAAMKYRQKLETKQEKMAKTISKKALGGEALDVVWNLTLAANIISANVDILHDEIGENKWLSYIQSQAERMRVLVGEMMNLTKLEMGDKQKDFVDFSLSEAVSGAALPFEGQAFEQEKQLELDIQDGIRYHGNPDQIKQLVGIFIDNALKYSEEHGQIRVTLQQTQNKKVLKVYNTGKGIPESEKEKIFQRFYRSDASRSRATGGYGLGLSIAQSIADAHKIRIQVESEYEHWICFVLTF